MNARIISTVLFFSIGTLLSRAGTFEDANAAFRAGEFQKAAEGYQKALDTEGHSAAAYYNLGNAYQRLEQYGPAILAYERAKLIMPRDPDLRANLERARKAVSAFEETEGNSSLASVTNYLSRNEWSWIVVGAAFVGAGIVFFAGYKRLEKRWMRNTAVGGVCTSVLVIAVAGTVLVMRGDEGDRAVIVSKDAAVRLSPFETAGSIGTPSAGRMVMLGKREGDFWYVTGEGMSGWVAAEDIARVEGQ